MSLYTLEEVLRATSGRAVGTIAETVSSISIDSREIEPGALFVAIKGERVDGHDYVETALAAGAHAALVSEARAGALPQDRLIVVPDAMAGLRDLAVAARARTWATIVAVTGSAGKTTTKEAIRVVLEAGGPTHASIKSFNNHWGVPLMLARLPADAIFAVFEIGMNHAGEITPLTRLVRPHVAVVTNVAAAHLEFFDSVEAIAHAKAEIFRGVEPGGVALINTDHAYSGILIEDGRAAGLTRIVTYGYDSFADWQAEAEKADGGMNLRVHHGSQILSLKLGLEGRHMAANAVAALAVANECGVNERLAVEALSRFEAPEGRGLALRLGPAERPLLLIDQSYNANSASMTAAMDVYAGHQAPDGRKVLVLGDMLELGASGPRLHAELADAVRATGADRIFLVGEAIAALAEALGPGAVTGHARAIEDIQDTILQSLAYGDAVMVKGSKGVRLAGLVQKIRERFQ